MPLNPAPAPAPPSTTSPSPLVPAKADCDCTGADECGDLPLPLLWDDAEDEALEVLVLARSGESVRPLVREVSSEGAGPLRDFVGLVESANRIELLPFEGVGEGG